MEELLEQLADVLKNESDLHQDLLKTADALNEAIKAQNLETIQTCTSNYDEQVYRIAKLEEKRIEYTSEIAGLLEIKEEIPKIDSILQRVPQTWRTRLSAIQLKLKEQIKELTKVNTSNRILLQEEISFINSSITMFQTPPRSTQYGGKGKTAVLTTSRNLINKVV